MKTIFKMRISIFLMILTAVVALAACEKDASEPNATETATASAENEDDSDYSTNNAGGEEKDIHQVLNEVMENQLEQCIMYWVHYYSADVVKEAFDSDDATNLSPYFVEGLSDEESNYIQNALQNAEYEMLDEQQITNIDFNLDLEYSSEFDISLNFSDSEMYIGILFAGEWICYAKVLEDGLYEYIFALAHEDKDGFDMDILFETRSITIRYFDRASSVEPLKIEEIEITGADMIEKIGRALRDSSEKAEPEEWDETSSDIIFHTADGDYYGKIAYPVYGDINPIIIIDGFYWYSCGELYDILGEIQR